MNEALHPAQVEAVEKLKHLRVGALYIERQEGKLRTVLSLVRYRLERGRIDGVIWLCMRRRVDMIQEGAERHAPELCARIEIVGIESLSHRLDSFLHLMHRAQSQRLMVVIDNGLLIKNPAALRTQRVIALCSRCAYRLLISDIPFTRRVGDMFSQWYALDWRILGYSSYWGFCTNHLGEGGAARNTAYLARAIEPYCAQILREDVQRVAGRSEYVWQFALPEEVMREYRRAVGRFCKNAPYSATGVYRMLQACHQVVSGRRIVQDYPLKTEPMYPEPEQNPRLCALLEVLRRLKQEKILILYRYTYERDTILEALRRIYGGATVGCYPEMMDTGRTMVLMNICCDEREAARLQASTIVYYSLDWDWRKRQEKERQCQNALMDGRLTVVNLVAADTIDLVHPAPPLEEGEPDSGP